MNTKHLSIALALAASLAIAPHVFAKNGADDTQPDDRGGRQEGSSSNSGRGSGAERLPRVKEALDAQRKALEERQDALKRLEEDDSSGPSDSSGRAAQFIVTNGPSQRGLERIEAGDLDEAKDSIEAERHSIKEAIKEGEHDLRDVFEHRREEAKEIIESRRASFKLEIEAQRAEGERTRAERKAQLESRLKEFKDTAKAEIAARVDGSLAAISENRVAFFTEAVNRIERVLDMIESRADKAEANGKDVAAVRSRISAAGDAIVTARAAVAVQAGKDYTAAVDAEAGAKNAFSKTRDQLRTDLAAVRTAVKAAYDAVKAAAAELATVPGIKDVEIEASASSSTSTSQ